MAKKANSIVTYDNFEISKVLESEAVKCEMEELLDSSTGCANKVHVLIRSHIEDKLGGVISDLNQKTSEIITEEVVEAINDSLKLHDDKKRLETEIKQLSRKIDSITDFTIENSIQQAEWEYQRETLNTELATVKGSFIAALKKALKVTKISEDLGALINDADMQCTSLKNGLEREADLLRAKAKVLNLVAGEMNIVSDLEESIISRLGRRISAKEIISCSDKKTPLINVLMK